MNPDFIRSTRVVQGSSSLPSGWRGVEQKVHFLIARGSRAKLLTAAAVTLLAAAGLLLLLRRQTPVEASFSFRRHSLGVQRTRPCTTADPCRFKIIADLDKKSKVISTNGKEYYISYLLSGWVWGGSDKLNVEWMKSEVTLKTKFNEEGRGMELSELVRFNGRLYTFDDRTGIVFELDRDQALPRYILMEGNGTTAKGMKIEWASVKDDKLWIGSFGKEFTSEDGKQILHGNPFWVVTIDSSGRIEHVNWEPVYSKIRQILKVSFPGYIIHEAVTWSEYLKRWIFLPRRISALPYDEAADEERASNKMILTSEDFAEVEVRTIDRPIVKRRGFSTFKFLPGTQDNIIIALKSEENEQEGTQRSFITAFSTTGRTILDDVEVPTAKKFEGIEFDED